MFPRDILEHYEVRESARTDRHSRSGPSQGYRSRFFRARRLATGLTVVFLLASCAGEGGTDQVDTSSSDTTSTMAVSRPEEATTTTGGVVTTAAGETVTAQTGQIVAAVDGRTWTGPISECSIDDDSIFVISEGEAEIQFLISPGGDGYGSVVASIGTSEQGEYGTTSDDYTLSVEGRSVALTLASITRLSDGAHVDNAVFSATCS